MNIKNWSLLLFLSAISGLSFTFSRIAIQGFSPAYIASARAIIGGIFVIVYGILISEQIHWKKDTKLFFGIGLLNFGIPFILYSFSATVLPAAHSAVLNATAPLFGAGLSYIILKEQMTIKKIMGLSIGILGVGIVFWQSLFLESDFTFFLGVFACLIGAFCYALAGVYLKHKKNTVSPVGLAGGAQLIAGLLLLPSAATQMPTATLTTNMISALLALGIINSAIAYLIYFKLISKIGATKTLTMTFIAPVFASGWGILLLNERITTQFLIGAPLVLLAAYLVTQGRDSIKPLSSNYEFNNKPPNIKIK